MRRGVVALVALVAAGCGQSNIEKKVDDLREEGAADVYWLGLEFRGLPLTHVERTFFVYGDCDPDPPLFGDGGCAPPLQIQNFPLARRPPGGFSIAGRPARCRRVAVPEVVGAFWESTGGVDVYVDRRALAIFGNSEELVIAAAAAVRPLDGTPRRRPPPWVTRVLDRACRA